MLGRRGFTGGVIRVVGGTRSRSSLGRRLGGCRSGSVTRDFRLLGDAREDCVCSTVKVG